MPTSFQFNSTQLAEIKRLRDIAAAPGNKTLAGGGVDLYTYVFKCVSGIDLNGDPLTRGASVVLDAVTNIQQPERVAMSWVYGALQVNKSNGIFSTVIREYNIRQGVLRGKGVFSAKDLDTASNAVAVLFADSILNPKLADGVTDNPSYHKLPSIQEIGDTDLNGVRNTLYPGNDAVGSELYLNQAWPGIVMLGSLGGQYTDRLLRYDESTQPAKLDSLADFKSMLFTWDAFKTAYDKTKLSGTSLSDFLIALNWPAVFVVQALAAVAATGGTDPARAVFNTLAGSQSTQSKDGKDGLALISTIGSKKFLDMLMGATVGSSQLGTTTDDNFVSRATTFFDAYRNTLQSIGATLLPTDPASLTALARTDVNARAALAALSVVGVKVSSVVAQKFSLFDPSTGQGNITDSWISDRAAFTAALYQDARGTAMPGGPSSTRYADLTSNTELRLGAGTTGPRVQLVFGGEGADTVGGQSAGDHLYGGGGEDVLNGMAGDDYLEGGSGTDTYQFTESYGNDTILDTDGNGTLTVDGAAPAAGKKIGDNLWQSDDKKWRYSLNDRDELLISQAGNANHITIKGWSVIGGSKLGIDLQGAATPTSSTTQTYTGDQRPKIIGVGQETQLTVTSDKPAYGTYAWGETTWAADGTLNNGLPEANFADVITGTAANDKISGLGGNDALSGGAGNDVIDGGTGDDLIGGGAGSDTIQGGAGNDFIASSATLNVAPRNKPTDSWSPPGGQAVITQGPGWGVYKDTKDGEPITIWSGTDTPSGTEADVIDGGAGNDHIIASGGADRAQGGTGDDQLDGMGGDDILEGNDGKDTINGDGLIKPGYLNSVAAQYHGADFIDGGAGDDELTGGGGSDDIYGGADNDKIWGDDTGNTGDANYLNLAYHGNDYSRIATKSVAAYARSTRARGLFHSKIHSKSEFGLAHQLSQRHIQGLGNGMHLEQSHIAISAFHSAHVAAVEPCQQRQLLLRDSLLQTCSTYRAAKGKQQRVAVVALGEGRHPRSIPNGRINIHGIYPQNCESKVQVLVPKEVV